MEKLNVARGIKTYRIDDAGEIYFNPADGEFVYDLGKAVEQIQTFYEECENSCEGLEDVEKFMKCRERNKKIVGALNTAFGYDVCSIVFKGVSAAAEADGLPVWCNFVIAVLDEVEKHQETKEIPAKAQAFLKKYQKYKK